MVLTINRLFAKTNGCIFVVIAGYCLVTISTVQRSLTKVNVSNSSQKLTIRFQKADYKDVNYLVYIRKMTMDAHLRKAGINMSDEQHTARVLDFFEESYLILVEKTIVGLIKLGIENAALHIRQFQVLPEYQGKGIGKHVLEVCKKKALEKGCSLTLNVLLENPAKELYLRNGFQIESSDTLQYFMRCNHLSGLESD